jgi:hypothetical protein
VSTPTSPCVEVSLLDFIGESLPPVVNTIPGGTCRTDALVDAEVSDFGASTTPDPGVESPSVWETAAFEVPAVAAVVPVVEVPSDSVVSLVPVAPAVSAVPPEPADPVSSAHATPAAVATAIPTPNATANPPTRPIYAA